MNLLTNSLRQLEQHEGKKTCLVYVNLLLQAPVLEGRLLLPQDQEPGMFNSQTEPFFLVVSVQDTGPGMASSDVTVTANH
jgi:hypothetical protein